MLLEADASCFTETGGCSVTSVTLIAHAWECAFCRGARVQVVFQDGAVIQSSDTTYHVCTQQPALRLRPNPQLQHLGPAPSPQALKVQQAPQV